MPGSPAYFAYQWLWSSLDLLFPATCGGCGGGKTRWCESCQVKINIIQPPICEICGVKIPTDRICLSCKKKAPVYKGLRSWAIYDGPLRSAIHKLKYKHDISLGIVLAGYLIDLLSTLGWEIDMVAPVPLGVARIKERGYNQAALLARPIAMSTGINYKPQALTRIRETRTQVGLTVTQRYENVKHAFRGELSVVEGKSVLIVDDVMTSGATLESCSAALMEAGSISVFALTLARAGKSY